MTETSFRTPILATKADTPTSTEEDDTGATRTDLSRFARRKSCGGASHTAPRVRSLDTACVAEPLPAT